MIPRPIQSGYKCHDSFIFVTSRIHIFAMPHTISTKCMTLCTTPDQLITFIDYSRIPIYMCTRIYYVYILTYIHTNIIRARFSALIVWYLVIKDEARMKQPEERGCTAQCVLALLIEVLSMLCANRQPSIRWKTKMTRRRTQFAQNTSSQTCISGDTLLTT